MLLVVQNLIAHLENKVEQSHSLEFEQDEKIKLLATSKILAYVLSSMLCQIEDQVADTSNNGMGNVGKVSIVIVSN